MNSEIVEGVYLAPFGNVGANICMVSREVGGLWWIQESRMASEEESGTPGAAAIHDDFVVGLEDAIRYLRDGQFLLVSDPRKAEALRAQMFPPKAMTIVIRGACRHWLSWLGGKVGLARKARGAGVAVTGPGGLLKALARCPQMLAWSKSLRSRLSLMT